MKSPTLDLVCELIKRASVTPDDAGCQSLLAERLRGSGFRIERMRFGDVDNLWARHGDESPLLVMLGHTDVVPPGPLDAWSSPPFEPQIREGWLYGRGAADMKGGVAAMVTACERFLEKCPQPAGSLAVLLTSDEEGSAIDGIRKVVPVLQDRNESIDWCLVGEPSSRDRLGDVMRIGRRGSLSGHITVRGIQGHIAYPHLAHNPVHDLARLIGELSARKWDEGHPPFPPTSFQVSNIKGGTGAENLIPGQADAHFNFRYSPAHSRDSLVDAVESTCRDLGIESEIEWHLSGEPFISEPGALTRALQEASTSILGIEPEGDTGGGTSDGRFIAPTGAEVVEFGPINATIHQIDERVGIEDLDRLSLVYESVLERLLSPR
ncbi:MAG: succinyl-diaminopimelate desuccinylase [Ectothiorhodospiraceae bacterium AqS1]|nr:succinyl-diaminopimelate desuccinylase [Ectothiorhodospiraceae bacterium AqS1]MBF2761782.1 succinyl-diaminopimelate desuccinylase [Ectothiorhodospiraceae bacterium AqS1]